MRSGPKSKPTQMHRLHGTFRVDRHRNRNEPKPPGDLKELPAPADLTEAEKGIWDYTIERAPPGILADIDRHLLRLWVQAEARYLQAREQQALLDEKPGLKMLVKTKAGDFVESPYVGIMLRTGRLSMRLSELLGFCPAGRAELTGGKTDDHEDDARWDYLQRAAANS